MASAERSAIAAAPLIERLRQKLRTAERTAGLGDGAHPLALGIPAIDVALGGGLAGGALHEIAAARETEIAAATGFALALAARTTANALWIAEDLALAESGAPYGPGLEQAGLAPERLITVAAARSRDVLWAMEEALRCRAVGLVIGELRVRDIDAVATRRLALAAAAGNTLGLILRPAPDDAPCPAATRWIVGAALSPAAHANAHGIGPPRLTARLVRNRRGHLGSWIVEWDSVEQRFVLAAKLSLWLARLSTDRIRRSWCEAERAARRMVRDAALRAAPHHEAEQPPSPESPLILRSRATADAARVKLAAMRGVSKDEGACTRSPIPDVSPLAVYGRRGNADVLVAVDAGAERLGLHAGLALAQARAMHPALAAMPEDPAADARLLAAVADACQRYTPLVAGDPPDGILLDIGGCAHLFGGEARLRDDLLARMTGFGFAARAAIAPTIGAAWAMARFGEAPSAATGVERDVLAPLPLAALRLPDATVAALARLGLKRIGDIADLPRPPLAARFGAGLLRQLDRALGREDEPLSPLLPVAPYVAEKSFPEPIAREEDVLATVERLAARLKTALTARGDGARRIELTLFRTDGAVRRIAAGTSRPVRDPQAIRALFVERLAALGDEFDPGFGFDLARLSVLIAEPCPQEQIGLGGSEEAAEIDRLVDRLSARLGRRRVTRLIAHDSHIPELAASAVAAQATARTEPGWDAFRRYRAEAELSPRPLRLLAKPEPIEAIAVVPDGPPLRFRWRRALHEVVAAEGPERIAGAWWSDGGSSAPARDYFRVEDKAGLRFWLFRLGLYRDTAPGQAALRWFLHGLYA